MIIASHMYPLHHIMIILWLLINKESSNKQGIDVDEINISEGFAGETLCTIIQKLQRDKQTLKNLEKVVIVAQAFFNQ